MRVPQEHGDDGRHEARWGHPAEARHADGAQAIASILTLALLSGKGENSPIPVAGEGNSPISVANWPTASSAFNPRSENCWEPVCFGQRNVLPENGFGSLVVRPPTRQTFCFQNGVDPALACAGIRFSKAMVPSCKTWIALGEVSGAAQP